MANPGVGTKFVSVNLNKSYGQHHHSSSSWSGRSRGSAHGSSGNGGGMVVLSRPRSSHKAAGPKLSVPPPLNLPSLRKEHEKFDLSGSGSGTAGGGVSGGGMRPGSSGMRWTKPVTAPLSEKDGLAISDRDASVGIDQDMHKGINGVNQGSSLYTPPSARLGSAGPVVSASPAVEKVSVLRGEDFPSLRATLVAASGPVSKQKDGFNQKQKQAMGDESAAEQKESSRSSSHVEILPESQASQYTYSGGLHENGDENQSMGGSKVLDQRKKQDNYFSGPLPLVRFNPRSDWADDERDTSHSLSDRSRDLGFSKGESYWDGDFDMPRASVIPQKPAYNSFDRLGQRDNEAGKISSSEVSKAEPYGRGVRVPSREGREGYSWRTSSPLSGDGVCLQEAKSERNNYGIRPSAVVMDARKENKNIQLPISDMQDDFGRKEPMSGQWRLPWNKAADSFSNHGTDRITRDRYGGEQFNKYDGFQNNVASKNTFGVKVFPANNPIRGLARDKHYMSKSEKPYLEDPFLKDVDDGRDPLSGGLVGVLKRKKDVLKQTDFHDPVRESFEAELERVQKLQEQERQRIIEEQEKAMELARREEEERMRLAREQEERQRRLEEEAREAAWRVEQERLEALRRAEEQKIAREEEKRRIIMEEERRKQAAKQKLLELEERMAKRQADAERAGSNSSMSDENVPRLLKEKDVSQLPDVGGVWDESERMVERITSSSDSSGMNRPFEMSSRANLSRDTPVKPANTWRDPFESGTSSNLVRPDQDITYGSRRDPSFGGRGFERKEFHGGVGYVPSRNYPKGGMPEPPMDEFAPMRGQRWNLADGEHCRKNTDVETEFPENLSDRLSDMDWGQSRPHGNSYSSYSEQFYQNPEVEGPYSFGRARYSMRQPRVLPPPSVATMQKSSSYRDEIDRPGPSAFLEKEMQYNTTTGNESTMQMGYDSGRRGILEDKSVIKQEFLRDQRVDQKPRCDSQSSLSVSSPPDSPVHLSHDDLDESGDYPAKSALEDNSDFLISDDGAVPVTSGQENISSATCSLSGDDGEWTVENSEHLQEQEEYDEDEEGYGEEDEVREGDDGNIDLCEEFDNMQLEENMVLGFNDNVEVCVTNVEFEKSSKNEENAFMMPLPSCESVEETAEKLGTSEQPHQLTDASAQVSMGCSSMLPDNERAPQSFSTSNFVVTPATSETPNSVDASCSSSLPLPAVPSSSNLVSHSSGRPLLHSSPAVSAQADLPIKLQFGLFSGPPLIPSAVPAIQIGTIQMPLHLNPQIGTALGPMQQSQPPIFQFGQLRYASPISPGVVPIAPQTMSLVQSNLPTNSINQKPGGPTSMQLDQDSTSSENLIKNDVLSSSVDKQSGFTVRYVDQPLGNTLNAVNPLHTGEKVESMVPSLQNEADNSQVDGSRSMDKFKAQEQEHQKATARNYRAFSNSKVMAGRSQIGWTSSQSVRKETDLNGPKVLGPVTSSTGKRYVFKVKNPAARTFLHDTEASNLDSAGYQQRPKRTVKRTEFRVRDIGEKRQTSGFDSPHELGIDDKSNVSTRYTVFSARSGSGKAILSNKHVKQTSESEGTRMDPGDAEDETGSTNQTIQQSQSAGGNFKRSSPSEDVDAPLQSGIVRVFEQPGIEAPSDEDDFIEVRSKRQMLIDKREQREREIKAKSRVMKVPRKTRHSQSSNGLAISKKTTSVRIRERETHSDFAPEGQGSSNLEVSVGFKTSMASQPLAPIGTPAVKSEAQSDTRPQKFNPLQVGSSAGKNLGTGLIFESKNKALDSVQTSLDAWGNSGINQQVMALTQSQLDDAMKPEQFDSRASGGDHIVSVTEPAVSSTSILTKEKSFSSSASPINSLLAGEKIQFGAVTSPTVLPPSSHAVSLGIGPPGPCRTEIQIPHKLPVVESGCNLFFEKENNSEEACVRLEDCEAEAEAAASAVAVAAISNNDDLVGNELGACSISVSDAKAFCSADVDDITAGVNGDKELANPPRSDEPLNVSLPADLSVETPPISLWPSLSSSQSTSSPMISHFPGGRPLLPFYEMNPMMASPIFAFGPNEESTSMQSQSQKSSTTSSGLPGSWPHSGVDSFYGPPTGFTGPFISPGGMPGVQGPPHMVVYNHFAPVGQFGQVGLSFMGTAFIPSGKQPDWKHNPASSPMIGEGDVNNLNLVSAQRNTSSVPPPIQHLAPGSPLLPMASPLAMFDVSPFQSSPEMSVHARWSHVPASPLQSVSMSMPLQQQGEGGVPSQFNSMPNVDQSIPINRFAETRSSTPSGSTHNCIEPTDTTSNQLPDVLGLVDPSSGSVPSTQSTAAKLSSMDVSTDTCNANALNSTNSGVSTSSSMKNHCSQKNVSNQYYSNSSGFNYQRGGASQKNNSGGEWPHRRTGFQGRNNSFGTEKNSSTKVKQIYVAKQTIGGKSATS